MDTRFKYLQDFSILPYRDSLPLTHWSATNLKYVANLIVQSYLKKAGEIGNIVHILVQSFIMKKVFWFTTKSSKLHTSKSLSTVGEHTFRTCMIIIY